MGLHCLSALVVVPTQGDEYEYRAIIRKSSLPFGVGRGSDALRLAKWLKITPSGLHCLSALVVVPTHIRDIRIVAAHEVFIAFRRWSWFRPSVIYSASFVKGWSSLPFGVGRGSDLIFDGLKLRDPGLGLHCLSALVVVPT